MKRKRALLLFGSLAVLTLGYVAWCGRCFYLPVPLPDLSEIPEEYHPAAYALLEQRGFTRNEPFSWDLFLSFVARPYQGKRAAISSKWDPAMGEYFVNRNSIASGSTSLALSFRVRFSGIEATILKVNSSGLRFEEVALARSPQ